MRLSGVQKIGIIVILGIIFVVGIPISLGLPINRIAEIRRIRPVTPLTPIYYLKVSRESLQQMFVLGDEDKANFQFLIAQKRISEALYLKSLGLDTMSENQKNIATRNIRKGENYLQRVDKNIDVGYLDKIMRDEKKLLKSL